MTKAFCSCDNEQCEYTGALSNFRKPITMQNMNWLSRDQVESYMKAWNIGAHKERVIYQICKQACEYNDLRKQLARDP